MIMILILKILSKQIKIKNKASIQLKIISKIINFNKVMKSSLNFDNGDS